MQPCPLCQQQQTEQIHQDRNRSYWRCQQCDLIFVPKQFHLAPDREKSIYDLHQNNSDDDGYCSFLRRAIEPIVKQLQPGKIGLDFGSGPGPVLASLLAEYGVDCHNYDKFYANDPKLLEQQYDVVTATEVVEHFTEPKSSWEQLVSLIKPSGVLSVMTKRHLGNERFKSWHYKNDRTHVSFYSEATLCWIAGLHGMSVKFASADVAVFTKR